MEFICKIGRPDGRVVDEVRRARDEATLRRELEGRGFHIFSVRRKGVLGRFSLGGGGGAQRVKPRVLLIFNQELVVLLRAGLPVVQALDLMVDRERDPLFHEILGEVRDRVKTGEDLSTAVAEFGDVFPPLYAPTLKAGERTGELEVVIERFVRYQELLSEARRRVVSALVYPAVLVGLSFLLIGVMTFYVVPKFTEFFASLSQELPFITRAIVGLSGFLRARWPILLPAVVVASLLLYQFRRTPTGALSMARWRLRLPLLGSLYQRMALSEFCRSLSTLLAGGIPVVMALENSVGAVGNAYIRASLRPIIQRVREGEPLHLALEATGVSPDVAVDMIKVGEATGALDQMLASASNFLDQEVETRLERLLSLVEPLMLVLMGTIVAILLLAVYLPLFSLLGNLQA